MSPLETTLLLTALNMGNTIIIFGSGLAQNNYKIALATIAACVASITLCLAALVGA